MPAAGQPRCARERARVARTSARVASRGFTHIANVQEASSCHRMEPYADHDKALREHHALLRARARALLVPTADLLARAAFLSRALLFHHHVESTVLFPYLRRSGADVSFLDPLEAEHR